MNVSVMFEGIADKANFEVSRTISFENVIG